VIRFACRKPNSSHRETGRARGETCQAISCADTPSPQCKRLACSLQRRLGMTKRQAVRDAQRTSSCRCSDHSPGCER